VGDQTKMTEKKCIICNSSFTVGKGQSVKKTCSDKCRKKHNNDRRRKNNKNHEETFNCKYCDKSVTRYRKRSGFCSRSCASKMYIKNGTYDNWKYRIQEKLGIEKKCEICNEYFYAQPHEKEKKKLCGLKKCRKSYMSRYMCENSPTKGKKEKEGVRQKVKDTLSKKYGVTNAFALAKHTSLSRPQKEIISFLKENTQYTIYYDYPIYKNDKLYKADIYIKEKNKIIEFNGTYWHADPRFYKEQYYHQKKQKFAKQIWEEDEIRLKDLKELGYDVEVIWEYDYKKQKQEIILELLDE
jgi:G:T-mismatch repair DNA endonuclease (very short patch repair protein)